MLDKRDETSAPFNMALATLERVNDILKKITEVSVEEPNPYVLIMKKCKLTKQLFLASVPLILDEAVKKSLLAKVNALTTSYSMEHNKIRNKTNYTVGKDAEKEIDVVIQKIEESLQKDKYFMPPKSDPRFAWKQ